MDYTDSAIINKPNTTIVTKPDTVVTKLENRLKETLIALGCDLSNATLMDYPTIIKTQLIHRDIYDKCNHGLLQAGDLKDEYTISIQLDDNKYGKISLKELKKYLGIIYNYIPPYISDDNTIVLPNIPQGKYILMYENKNHEPLRDYTEISKLYI